MVGCFVYFNGFLQHVYPQLNDICTDNANIMSSDQLLALREKLTNFKTETLHQIVVLTIADLGDDTIENYAFQVFEQNQLGQEGADNNLLIQFSENDRKVRIEVG